MHYCVYDKDFFYYWLSELTKLFTFDKKNWKLEEKCLCLQLLMNKVSYAICQSHEDNSSNTEGTIKIPKSI